MTIVRHDVENCETVNCFQCKITTFHVAAAAQPTRKPGIIAQAEFGQQATKDNEAYRRLRKEGYQPRGIKNAAKAEATAESRFELETGYQLSSVPVGKKYDEVQESIHKGEIMSPLKKLDA